MGWFLENSDSWSMQVILGNFVPSLGYPDLFFKKFQSLNGTVKQPLNEFETEWWFYQGVHKFHNYY